MKLADDKALVNENKKKVARLQRLARTRGLRLIKSRSRNLDSYNHGGYMITELYSNHIMVGFKFDLTIDEAEKWLLE